MRFLTIALSALVWTSSVHAQYFSEGWAPGKPTTGAAPPAPEFTTVPAPTKSPVGRGSLLEKILSSEPVAYLLSKAGVNITERIQNQPDLWDERIQLITDDNYDELIVNEPLTEEEEKLRVWFLVITVAAAREGGLSKYVDEVFDAAYNESLAEGDLPHVRWGRIDYLNVTRITTKWGVWRVPLVVILTDRGQTLRFYKASHLRLKVELLREFLLTKSWEGNPPWSSSFAPGGSREYVLEYLAIIMSVWYNNLVRIPKWILFVVTGGIASVIMNFMHRNSDVDPQPQTQSKPKLEAATAPATSAPSSSTSGSTSVATKKGAKSRKGKK